MACLNAWCGEKSSPNSLETQCLETDKNSCLRKKTVNGKEFPGKMYVLLYFFIRLKMHTIPAMLAILDVHYWVNMWPLNSTQPINLKLCSNQSIKYNSWFGMRGPPKILLPWVSIPVNWSLIALLPLALLTPKLNQFTFE